MARKRMVTRTINTTCVSVMCFEQESEEQVFEEILLPGIVSAEVAFTKAKTRLKGSGKIPLKVVNVTVTGQLYGMPEQKFIELADLLDGPDGGVEESDYDED